MARGAFGIVVTVVGLAPLLCAAGGCGSQAAAVPNPVYQGWAGFEPGSSVTLKCDRKSGDTQRTVEVTQRLVERTPEHIVLERTIITTGGQQRPPVVTTKVEPAMIEPVDSPRTHPQARFSDLGTDSVEIKGRSYPCRVSQWELHVAFGEPVPSSEDVRLRLSTNQEIPGGTARIHLVRHSPSHDMELSGQAIDFKAVRKGGK
ncbi:MAG: hypothetical protein ACE15C_07310 [Phycisphaerae bacterium]